MEGFEEISKLFLQEIHKNQIPGAIAAIFRDGQQVYLTCNGVADLETSQAISEETIFRIYSMTKPITAVAAMRFIEQGQLRLEDPISKYLPEYKDMKVLDKGRLVDAKRQITIKDLLHMTSGIVYPDPDPAGMIMAQCFDDIHQAIKEGRDYSTREVVRRIASCPLAFQPGSGWRYGLSADVLVAVLEVISGKSIGELFQREIFEPLGMKDTGFYVPKDKQHRFAQLYKQIQIPHPSTGVLESSLLVDDDRHLGLTKCQQPPSFESGGAGICSTLKDYSIFARMLAAGGSFGGVKILEPNTVELFTHNQLNELQGACLDFPQLQGYGYGHLMRVRLGDQEVDDLGVTGEFGWDGWTGPYFTINLKDNVVFIYMVQISGYNNWELNKNLRNVLYSLVKD